MQIGITGGIGAGKSYVARRIAEQYGIPVYDCDAQAKRLNEESNVIRQGLTNLVGPEVYGADGRLNKQVLANYLFTCEENAQRVNAIVHPIVAQHFQQWSKAYDVAALESAILFDSGFNRLVDYTINVTAPQTLCLERAMQRDTASAEAIKRRMQLQMPDSERSRLAHYTIINDGRALDPQIEQILSNIKNQSNK